MNYEREALLEALAAEYALGTLQGKARDRFARLVAQSLAARSALWRWERWFGEWAMTVPEREPSAEVWQQLSARLFPANVPVAPASTLGWRRFALLSVFAFVVSSTGWWQSAERAVPTHVAQILSQGNAPLWVISADLERGTLAARALNVQAQALDRVYELWMLPASGSPRSLGLLPVGNNRSRIALPPGLLALLQRAEGLAVSVEPAGGSPTGQPTGPVVHQAALTAL